MTINGLKAACILLTISVEHLSYKRGGQEQSCAVLFCLKRKFDILSMWCDDARVSLFLFPENIYN